MEQMLRLLHACGMPAGDVDFINSDGLVMHKLLMEVRKKIRWMRGRRGRCMRAETTYEILHRMFCAQHVKGAV